MPRYPPGYPWPNLPLGNGEKKVLFLENIQYKYPNISHISNLNPNMKFTISPISTPKIVLIVEFQIEPYIFQMPQM